MRKGSARGRAATAQLPLHRQSLAIEQGANRARHRPIGPRHLTLKKGQNLPGSPTRMRPPHRKALLRDRLGNLLRMVQRRPTTIPQTLYAGFLIALKPFVSDPSANAEPPAHRRKRLLVLLGRNHKAHPFFHGTGLHPSHQQGPPRRSVDLLPMSLVYSVTYVAGLDPNRPPPAGERWKIAHRAHSVFNGTGF